MTVPPSDVSAPYAAMYDHIQHLPAAWRWTAVRDMADSDNPPRGGTQLPNQGSVNDGLPANGLSEAATAGARPAPTAEEVGRCWQEADPARVQHPDCREGTTAVAAPPAPGHNPFADEAPRSDEELAEYMQQCQADRDEP